MQTSDFDYELPRELIATQPAERRDESRLLVLDRDSGKVQHGHFNSLPELLQPGDLVVMNNSRVMKARLRGVRRKTDAGVEALLLEQVLDADAGADGNSRWLAMCRPARKFHIGEMIDFNGGELAARVIAEGDDGERTLEFARPDILPLLEKYGEIPLPPYIVQRRKEVGKTGQKIDDAVRYQTVYAKQLGSVAAPTAGLHFTTELFERLESAGVNRAYVTLHVGAGTFKPVEVENPAEHPMHSEFYEVPEATAQAIKETRERGGRIIAVGTTTVRTLESAWNDTTRDFRRGRHSTRLLILPGYEFKVVDAMVTNFHLPKSSLLMMISAFAGREKVMVAYTEAIARKYRFYSYGDAMFVG